MADFLLELLSEEIPARMQAKARNDLARLFAECTEAAGLRTGAVDVFSTPRRLALIARDVAEATEASREEVKGPRSSAPPQALDGFLRKTGLPKEQIEERDGVYFAVIERAGRPAAEILEQRIPFVIFNFPWPKSMRWGGGDLRWIRPLHNVLAILGDKPLNIDLSKWGSVYVNKNDPPDMKIIAEFSNVTSKPQTLGHRFHHSGPITVGGAADYVEKLRACHVIVDQEERERIIREGAEAATNEIGLTLLPDEGMVVENVGLTEWPVPLVGSFEADFLDVPREVIVLTMRTNQKYFACANDEGLLAPVFVCVANVAAKDGGEAIVEGNRRVLAARLADARFFWEQDLKIPLEEQAKKLSGIVFHEKLGAIADKVERVAKLARWLVDQGIVKADAHRVERAAQLAKADLVTGMVGEFPELQGVIGGYLAAAQGEPSEIADAIRDHYKPVGQGDDVPTAPVTVALALADKLDSLFSFFQAGILPTGSKDPFALRRSALGSISLIRKNALDIEIGQVIRMGWQSPAFGGAGEAIIDFFIDRLKVALKDEGVRHDLIGASTSWRGKLDGRLDRVERRAYALQSFVETEDGADLLTAYKRAANILKKEKWEGSCAGPESDLEPQERRLVAALNGAEPKASTAIDKEDFTAAMAALATLRQPIDQFFDHVTVNDPDQAKRERRLNLLMRFRDAVNGVADFSKIDG